MFKIKRIMKSKVGDVIEIPGKKGFWIVEKTEMTGGGTGHGPHDIYPDAWHVTARRLEGNEAVGKPFVFTQDTNCFNTCIEGVKTVEKRVAKWVRA
jgi:hypothetical protein